MLTASPQILAKSDKSVAPLGYTVFVNTLSRSELNATGVVHFQISKLKHSFILYANYDPRIEIQDRLVDGPGVGGRPEFEFCGDGLLDSPEVLPPYVLPSVRIRMALVLPPDDALSGVPDREFDGLPPDELLGLLDGEFCGLPPDELLGVWDRDDTESPELLPPSELRGLGLCMPTLDASVP